MLGNYHGVGSWSLRNASTGDLVAARVEIAQTRADRNRGLLGRDFLPPDQALIITPCCSIHTFFMRFPIDVIFVRRNGDVVKICRQLSARRLRAAWGAHAAVELAGGAPGTASVRAGHRLELITSVGP